MGEQLVVELKNRLIVLFSCALALLLALNVLGKVALDAMVLLSEVAGSSPILEEDWLPPDSNLNQFKVLLIEM